MNKPKRPCPVGPVIFKLREDLGISRYRLAKETGKSIDQIRTMERGEVEPRISTVIEMAKPLHIDPYELFKLIVDALLEDKAKEAAEEKAENPASSPED